MHKCCKEIFKLFANNTSKEIRICLVFLNYTSGCLKFSKNFSIFEVEHTSGCLKFSKNFSIFEVEHKSFPMINHFSYFDIKHGIWGGGQWSNWALPPPKRIQFSSTPVRIWLKSTQTLKIFQLFLSSLESADFSILVQ